MKLTTTRSPGLALCNSARALRLFSAVACGPTRVVSSTRSNNLPCWARTAGQAGEEVPDHQGGPAGAVAVRVEVRVDLDEVETCHCCRLPRRPGAVRHLLRR